MTTRRFALIFALLISGCSVLPIASVDTDQTSATQIAELEAQRRAENEEILRRARISQSNYTPPPSLIEVAVQGFSWPTHTERDEVNYWVERYLRDQDQFEAILARAEPFLFHILNQLEAKELPSELAFLPFVESGFRPDVDSWIGAAGLWQFMPATGRYLGLEQDWWIDERRSVDNSTDAAIRYLSYLHDYFDQDWFMALAAYNTGEGNLGKAMRARPNADYWGLNLNSETASFVPKLLAVIHLLENSEELELNLPYWPNQPHFETYEADRQLDLEAVASHLELRQHELLSLNAHYPQAITPPNRNARVLLPIGKADSLANIIESLPEVTGPSWAHYEVRSGDNISIIADRMGVSVRAVMEANQLSNHLIHPGDDLLIPSPTRAQPDPEITGSVAMVRLGDSIWLIARRYGISRSTLLAANGLEADDYIFPGQTLKLSIDREGDSRLTHEVQNGDSLYDIAALYGVRLTELKRWNSLGNSNLIRPGDQLTIWQAVD
ncbi:MAG: LysM peptidoglycan-binding domain-containing protein [Porticoccaceae bacterium]|nr:LysM peptidoglycan-binding domain-containing protein [Porticoccaceae bacterium]